jgi:cell wall-associated NlpC family hydrolase
MQKSPVARLRPRRRLLALAATIGALAATAVSLGAPALANPAGPHDPFGAVTKTVAAAGGLTFTGWAADPDALTSNVRVAAVLDGRTIIGHTDTSVANATVTNKYATGPTPGFTLTVSVPTGNHTVCVLARPIGAGLTTLLKCVPTPLGTVLSSAQLATHNPVGAITRHVAHSSSIRFSGWASDPDYVVRRATVVLYVDSVSRATVTTTTNPTPTAAAGPASAFDITVPVTSGAHVGCIWVVNVGLGSNAFLGCRAVDTRGPAGTGSVTTPKLNTEVVAEAKRHLGQAYVWGAAGPKTFDCSGLVKYSYAKYGFTTPRTSEDQFAAARVIPAARAVPGDLVFWYDNEGDVYHVGIYTAPGMTIAAIDPADGVAYQKLWDPTIVSYGSFTHV